MRKSLFLLSAALLSTSLAAPAFAQWMWRDAAGRVHASDLPPPQTIPENSILKRPEANRVLQRKAAELAAPPASAASATSSAQVRTDPELEARRRRLEQDQAAQRKQEQAREEARVSAQRADNCKRARDQLRTLDSGTRIARVNAQGEREVVDDTVRAQESQRARAVIASDCR